jgi:hypothetical protein
MKKLCGSIALIVTLLMNSPAMSQQLKVAENLRHDQVMMPAAAPERSRMAPVDYSMFIEDGAAGILIYYDERQTKWDVDYVEVYDLLGNLLLVSWTDQTGVCQVAMNRGLLNADEPHVEGTLVVIGVGQEI